MVRKRKVKSHKVKYTDRILICHICKKPGGTLLKDEEGFFHQKCRR